MKFSILDTLKGIIQQEAWVSLFDTQINISMESQSVYDNFLVRKIQEKMNVLKKQSEDKGIINPRFTICKSNFSELITFIPLLDKRKVIMISLDLCSLVFSVLLEEKVKKKDDLLFRFLNTQ